MHYTVVRFIQILCKDEDAKMQEIKVEIMNFFCPVWEVRQLYLEKYVARCDICFQTKILKNWYIQLCLLEIAPLLTKR